MSEKLNGDFEIEPKIFTKILVAADDLAHYVNKARSFGVKDVTAYSGEGKPGVVIINDILPDVNADLLVCGSKTKPLTGRKRVFLGSQASYMSQNAPCSVIVVR